MATDEFLSLLWRERGTAIMRASDRGVAAQAMRAAIRGGFRIIEFTMTTPDVLGLIREFAADPEVCVGAGTVLTVEDARTAVEAGARFLVSPVVDEAVIAAAHALGVPMMPGTYSPTEMYRAHLAGAQLQKLFPVTAAGPAHVRSVLGPLPFLRIVPTNGVDRDNAAEYLRAGAFACGFVTPLFDAQAMATGDFAGIEARARALREALFTVERAESPPEH
jgi:2-dehydro-3-deoxyphosphogluconate aldolase/(4S)-4-hydroxy-2-oxoglutarate aldolase